MIETIIPSLESGPYSLKISRTKLTAADEENILTINLSGVCCIMRIDGVILDEMSGYSVKGRG